MPCLMKASKSCSSDTMTFSCNLWSYCRCRKSFQVLFFTHFQSSFCLPAKRVKKVGPEAVSRSPVDEVSPALPFFLRWSFVLACSWHGGREEGMGRVSKQSKNPPSGSSSAPLSSIQFGFRRRQIVHRSVLYTVSRASRE